jgi:hypothetical protein
MSDEEDAEMLKATYWADLIAQAEWKAVLGHDDCSPSAKSRLKKKASGWLIALARIYLLRPELFAEIADRANTSYEQQVEDESFLLQTVRNIAERQLAVTPGEAICSSVWIEQGEA